MGIVHRTTLAHCLKDTHGHWPPIEPNRNENLSEWLQVEQRDRAV